MTADELRVKLEIARMYYQDYAAIAENQIGKPGERAAWERADKYWLYTVQALKTDLESAERMEALDALAADLADTHLSLEMDTRI